jgi:hypothetical protein
MNGSTILHIKALSESPDNGIVQSSIHVNNGLFIGVQVSFDEIGLKLSSI